MWLMLQQDTPDDYILSTGKNYSVKELIEVAFKTQNIKIEWKGEGLDEIGFDKNNGREYVFVDKNQIRPAEVDKLVGDCSKAKTTLKWEHTYCFHDLIKEMVEYDLKN
jgi:GDPmannose 4,6-dehydratase